jgi:hypothetical protein
MSWLYEGNLDARRKDWASGRSAEIESLKPPSGAETSVFLGPAEYFDLTAKRAQGATQRNPMLSDCIKIVLVDRQRALIRFVPV